MRRLAPLALAAFGLLVSGCGTERPNAAGLEDASVSPAPTSPTSATSTSSPGPTGALEGFPLALGYDEENGDDHSPVTVVSRPGMSAYESCGTTAWDPRAGTTDLIGVEFRGEAEWTRRRTLALYPTSHDAGAALDAARAALAACPEERVGDGYISVTTVNDDVRLGDQSVVWADTGGLREDGEVRFDTGPTVYHLVRVGRAVLASSVYG
jgi:hypothetical protein